MLGGNTRAGSNTPLGYALAVVGIAFLLTVCVSLLRDPNSRFSRRFILGWPTPLKADQERFVRVLGAIGIVITGIVAIGLTIDGIDRLISN